MSTLTKLKLANASRKPVEETPEERMRGRMVAHLTEQLEMAKALVEGRAYKATHFSTSRISTLKSSPRKAGRGLGLPFSASTTGIGCFSKWPFLAA